MKKCHTYCNCETIVSVTTGFEDDWGYWDVCTKCGKKLEGGHHYYNHFDGVDHDDGEDHDDEASDV